MALPPLSFSLRSYAHGLLSRCTSGTALGRLQCQPEGTLRTDCTGECAHQWGGQAFRWAYEIKKNKRKRRITNQVPLAHTKFALRIVPGVCLTWRSKCWWSLKVCNTAKSCHFSGVACGRGSERGATFATKHSLLFKHHFTFKKSFKYLHSLLNRFSFL